MTDRERLLEELRPVAFAIAYQMLGTVSEAEDVVQEALLRVHQRLRAGERIGSPRMFVATVTTRLAINELRSARARREQYVGEWLPEPIITDGSDDPAQHAEMADSLSLVMLVLLESLSPEQRAVLLLHDVFDYGYPEIAAIVGKSEGNVRQLATRARRHVEQRRPRFQTTREQRDELVARFFEAAEQGDLAGLEALLAADVEMTSDGGGKVPALARSLRGRSSVAQTLVNWSKVGLGILGVSLRPVEVNGGPGALYLDAQQRLIGDWRSTSPAVGSGASARSPTPTSSRTSDHSATSKRYWSPRDELRRSRHVALQLFGSRPLPQISEIRARR
jgi:RNA polymerase sigma factor (sigma-70 family)